MSPELLAERSLNASAAVTAHQVEAEGDQHQVGEQVKDGAHRQLTGQAMLASPSAPAIAPAAA
jgi:hypothetical protein